MQVNTRIPELLSPAGDFEKLTMAVCYGADAVYLSGREFGMRAAAASFDTEQLLNAISFAHSKGVKVYVTCNTLPREEEMERLPDYLSFLQHAGADGLIIADVGVLALAKKYAPFVKYHISTQFGIVNSAAANYLYEQGADTVVLARELSLEEIRRIRNNTPAELRLEAFVHGAMCVSFSGRCLLSNYLTGRDANRGQCAQPCRWKYHLMEETRPGEFYEITEDGGTFIMNSNDLCMIEHLKELSDAGIDSFKIEGRMKSAYYTAVITNAYRHAIDDIRKGTPVDSVWIEETEKVSHRPYCTGFFYGDPGQHYGSSSYSQTADVVAIVESCDENGNAVLTQRNRFSAGDRLELINPEAKPMLFNAERLTDSSGAEIPDTRHPMMHFCMKLPVPVPKYTVVRKLRSIS